GLVPFVRKRRSRARGPRTLKRASAPCPEWRGCGARVSRAKTMALDNLDPSIPLQAGKIQIGDPQTQNAFLAMQLRQQQLRQVQQSENALRQLYSPGNLDESGRPTANAMGQYMQADPRGGMQLQQQFGQMDERKAHAALLQSE